MTLTISNRLKLALLFSTLVLFLPLLAMNFTSEVNWGVFDFVFAGILLYSGSIAIEYIFQKANRNILKVLYSAAIISILILIWAQLAVGIF